MGTLDDETTDTPNAPSVYRTSPTEEPDGPDDDGGGMLVRQWRPMLNRWLLTLNPGRTQDEYEKSVRYFFETPGVPQRLSDITADLLLAYRGSLAMRADRRRRSMPRRAATAARRDALWTAEASAGALSGAAPDGQGSQSAHASQRASLRQGPLSPATVNIRLTALRQFLLFASEHDALPAPLTAERIRSALRRLRNERRRPYQVLAEEEWGAFLEAALSPIEQVAPISESPAPPASPAPYAPRGPWGVTRAAREQQRAALQPPTPTEGSAEGSTEGEAPDPRRAPHAQRRERRTGAHTAQRDHALISLALATGLRAIELSLLDVGDLVSERRRGRVEWWLALPDEKTKGQRGGRTLPLAPELMATLLAYLRSTGRSWDNPEHRATPLFLALPGGRPPLREEVTSQAVAHAHGEPDRRYRRLRPEQIRGVIHRVEAQWQAQRRAANAPDSAADEATEHAGENLHLSPHALRHSAAIALLLGDEASERPPASVEHVRGWLGHFDIRTTQRYLAHIESRDQRRRFAIRPQARPSSTSPTPDAAPGQPSLFEDD